MEKVEVARGIALACLVALVSMACGSSDGGGSGNGSSGSAGAAGSSGGSGGSGGSAAGQGAGGSAGAGSAGAAGTQNVPDVFNPNVARPSHDCRIDTSVKYCVSIAGTLDGQPIDLHCTSAVLPGAIFRSPDRWPISCSDDPLASIGNHYQVDVPIQPPGPFRHDIPPAGNVLGANVIVERDDQGGDSKSGHFLGGIMAGQVVEAPGTANDIMSGTFRATRIAPAANCRGFGSSVCKPADINGTFYAEHYLKP